MSEEEGREREREGRKREREKFRSEVKYEGIDGENGGSEFKLKK